MSRAKELLLVLSAVALVVLLLSRQGGKNSDPVPVVASASPQMTPVSSPSTPLSQEENSEMDEAKEMPPSTPEILARGKGLYETNCAICHGNNLAGDGPARTNLDPLPTDLRNPARYKYGHLEPAIYRSTMYGIEATAMAPWDGIMTPEEVWAVSHYVRSMQILVETEN